MGDSVKVDEFLTTDITNKLILAFDFNTLEGNEIIKFYKVSQRAQVKEFCCLTLLVKSHTI